MAGPLRFQNFRSYIADKPDDPDIRACLRLNIHGGENALLWAHRVGLDNIEGYVLPLLGMAPIFFSVKVCPVGFKDVLDALPEGLYKCGAISAKLHVFDGFLASNGGKLFQ